MQLPEDLLCAEFRRAHRGDLRFELLRQEAQNIRFL
jgi:hypothetical protein